MLYVSIILNDNMSFYDFIMQDEILKLQSGNFYIRSNETIILTNQIESFLGVRRNLIGGLITGLIYILLETIYIYSFLYNKNLSILKNYAIEQSVIEKHFFYFSLLGNL